MWLYRQEATQVSYHHAKFDGHRHSGNGDAFNLPRDLDVITSPAPTWLVSFESNSISYILAKFGAIGLIEMEISILNQILHGHLEKSWTRSLDPPYCEIFKTWNTDLQFRSPRYGWQKKQEKEQHRQLQSVLRLTQTQKCTQPRTLILIMTSQRLKWMAWFKNISRTEHDFYMEKKNC